MTTDDFDSEADPLSLQMPLPVIVTLSCMHTPMWRVRPLPMGLDEIWCFKCAKARHVIGLGVKTLQWYWRCDTCDTRRYYGVNNDAAIAYAHRHADDNQHFVRVFDHGRLVGIHDHLPTDVSLDEMETL